MAKPKVLLGDIDVGKHTALTLDAGGWNGNTETQISIKVGAK